MLAGVMRGCGRQKVGAAVNLVTYWVIGLPAACLLAFPGGLGALGLWAGLACTASVQALLMSLTVFRCDDDNSLMWQHLAWCQGRWRGRGDLFLLLG